MPRRCRGGLGWETWCAGSETERKKRPSFARIGRLKPAPPRSPTGHDEESASYRWVSGEKTKQGLKVAARIERLRIQARRRHRLRPAESTGAYCPGSRRGRREPIQGGRGDGSPRRRDRKHQGAWGPGDEPREQRHAGDRSEERRV